MSDIGNLKIGGRKLRPNEYAKSVEQVLTRNIYDVLDKIGVSLADEFAKNAPVSSGALASSISLLGVKENKGSYSIEIYLGVDYHDYIDKGVRGIRNKAKTIPNADGRNYQFKNWGMPEEALRGLKEWAKKRNINLEAKAKIDGKRVNRKKIFKSNDNAIRHFALTIKRDGIDARKYKDKSLKNVMPKYQKELNQVGYNSLILKVVK
jgi:hypothetical protein